jgi:hypothetical protein
MNLIKYLENGKRMYKADKGYEALFKHCANGMIAVTEEHYDNEVEDMIWAHGAVGISISRIDTADNKRNQ